MAEAVKCDCCDRMREERGNIQLMLPFEMKWSDRSYFGGYIKLPFGRSVCNECKATLENSLKEMFSFTVGERL